MKAQNEQLKMQIDGLKKALEISLKNLSQAKDEKLKVIKEIEFLKELVMTIESSKAKEINDLNYVKKDIEIMWIENLKLWETIVTDEGQLIFLKE